MAKCSDPLALLRYKLMHLPSQWAYRTQLALSNPCSCKGAMSATAARIRTYFRLMVIYHHPAEPLQFLSWQMNNLGVC